MSILERLHVLVLAVSVSAASLVPSCGAPRRPTPTPTPPAPTMRVVEFVVRGPGDTPVPGARVTLQGGVFGGDCAAATDGSGYTACTLVPGALTATQVTVTADGFAEFSEHVDLPPNVSAWVLIGDGESKSAHDVHLASLQPRGPPTPRIAGRLRAGAGRFFNDAGPFPWLGISEFDFIHLVRTGREAEVQRRLDRAVMIGGRNVFRVFARAVNLFQLDASQPGYWAAVDRTLALVNARGAYVELCLLPDAQNLDDATRESLVRQFGERYRDTPGWIPQITNEPWQNGWSSAVDPKLLRLGDVLAVILGHRDFSIGDPQDGDDPDASAETVRQAVELGRHSNVIVIHSSRKGGAQPMDDRYRRYIDHGESFFDVMAEVRKANAGAACVNDEPMGVASQRWVPLPGGKTYEREFEPEAVLADELTTLFIGCGHTLHYISSQDDGLPGLDLLGRISPRISPDPVWSYRNDSWQGSATRGYAGFGKVRTYTAGTQAFVLANGSNKGTVNWANGFAQDETLFDGQHVTVWHAHQ